MPTDQTRWTWRHEEQRAGAVAAATYQIATLRSAIQQIRAAEAEIRDLTSRQILADARAGIAEALAEAQTIVRLMEAAGRGR